MVNPGNLRRRNEVNKEYTMDVALAKTIAYSTVFSYPLTLVELRRWFLGTRLDGTSVSLAGLKDALEKIGVTEIKTVGEKLDHNSMEAMRNEETDDEKLDGRVASEMKAGYKLNGKVIEAAKVVVYKLK